jgi:hypothetical protein
MTLFYEVKLHIIFGPHSANLRMKIYFFSKKIGSIKDIFNENLKCAAHTKQINGHPVAKVTKTLRAS